MVLTREGYSGKADDRENRQIDGQGGQHNLGVVVTPSKIVLTRKCYK